MSPLRLTPASVFYWIGRFLLYWLSLIAIGAMLGMVLYLTIGPLVAPDWTLGELALRGAKNGAKWLGIVWGTGGSLVLCFIHGHRLHEKRKASAES